jgi:hypothetical protein
LTGSFDRTEIRCVDGENLRQQPAFLTRLWVFTLTIIANHASC